VRTRWPSRKLMLLTMLVVRAVISMASLARAVPRAVNRSTKDCGATRCAITVTAIPPAIPGGPGREPGGGPPGLTAGVWLDPHPMTASAMSATATRAITGKGLLLFKFLQGFCKEKL
jgi:hypothetical protein